MASDFDHVIATAMKHEAAGMVELGVVSGAAPSRSIPLDESDIAFCGITPIPECDGWSRDQQLASRAVAVYSHAGIVNEQDPGAIAWHSDRDGGNAIPVFPVDTLERAHV